MLDQFKIKSYRGEYQVDVCEDSFAILAKLLSQKTQFIVDQHVHQLYQKQFSKYLPNAKIVLIEALETNKNLDRVSLYVQKLMENQVKIDHTLVAIGGGIIQDLTCFLASTLFRGMSWQFVPTTLLAQADSCIGSKSSINVGEFKNLMGTFWPPQRILLDLAFLDTLEHRDILSGIGEILKVHMIQGITYFEELLVKYDELLSSRQTLLHFIEKSLLYKKEKIELDEFDKGPRNVMNYGHSYGHALETATDFAIPHGIAVSMGMDMANFQSLQMSRISKVQFDKWHSCLRKNYKDYLDVEVPITNFLTALSKDKKNIGDDLSLILVRADGPIEKVKVAKNASFKQNCEDFFQIMQRDI